MQRSEAFYRYAVYGEEDGPLTIDYFFWVLRSDEEVILLDTGFDPAAGKRRGRTLLVEPLAALAGLDIAPDDVSQIIVSHCHYDHIGNLARFPDAAIVIERAELDFWTGPMARRAQFAEPTEPSELAYLEAAAAAGRVRCLDGGGRIADGIEVLAVGGHCPGQLVTLVGPPSACTVLASDALHFYEEMDRDMPFAILSDLAATYTAYETLRSLERAGGAIVAGHDPAVPGRFATSAPRADEFVTRLR
jgi:glyoxylase-like metal-dependent hydrolase (beta-lactamase superfamily II)